MKRALRTIIAMFAMAIVAVTSMGLVACGEDESKTLFIEIIDGGFGVDWMNDLASAFQAKHSGIKVKVTKGVDSTQYETYLKAGKTRTDLFFTTDHMMKYQYNDNITLNGKTYDCYLESLQDLYNNPEFGGKMNPLVKEFYTVKRTNGTTNIYVAPYSIGVTGILVNKDNWKASWGDYPRTTDELFELCKKIKTNNKTPFVHSVEKSYYEILTEQFVMQYEGIEEIDNFWLGKDKSGKVPSAAIMKYPGIEKAYEVMAELLNYDNGYQDSHSTEWDFNEAQTAFVESSNGIVMMENGDWILSEIAKKNPDILNTANIEFMQTPIISALGEKLGISDDILSNIVKYVDGERKTIPSFTSTATNPNTGKLYTADEVVAAVTEARGVVPTSGFWHSAFIPAFSDQIALAKEFLLFMASDEGLAICANKGHAMPFTYDYDKSNIGEFTKNVLNTMYNGKYIYCFSRAKEPLFVRTTLRMFNNSGIDTGFIKYFSDPTHAKESAASLAKKFYDDNYTVVRNDWDKILSDAGL